MEEPKDRLRGDSPRREWAPVWLSALAAAAFLASAVASVFRPPIADGDARFAHGQRPRDRPWPTQVVERAACGGIALSLPVPDEPAPSLLALPVMAEADVAREVAAALRQAAPTPRIVAAAEPLVLRRPARPAGEPAPVSFDPRLSTHLPRWASEPLGGLPVAMVLPSAPAWRAGYARGPAFDLDWPRLVAKAKTAEPAKLGEAIGRLSNRFANPPRRLIAAASRRLAYRPAALRVADAAPSKAWPLRIGPGDRLAIATTPWRAEQIAKPIERRTGQSDSPRPHSLDAEAEGGAGNPLQTLRGAAGALFDFTPLREAAEWSLRLLTPGDGEDAAAKDAEAAPPDSAVREAALHYPVRLVSGVEAIASRPLARPIETDELVGTLRAIRATSPALRDPDAWLAYAESCRLRGVQPPAVLGQGVATESRPLPLRLAARPSAGSSGPVPGLHAFAKDHAAPTASRPSLVAPIEAFRSPAAPRLAQSVALAAPGLVEPSGARQQALAQQIEARYRNANLRVAIADPLMERFLLIPEPRLEPVRDHIAGVFVRGQSTTDTRLSIRLLPDPHVLRIGLEARGVVHARTVAEPGPVTFRNRSSTSFLARKIITVDRTGLHAEPTLCTSYNQTRLTGLGSRFDRVPVLSAVVRSRAMDEMDSRQPIAKRQSEAKVNRRVSLSIDQQAEEAIARLRSRYQTDLALRAERLGVPMTPIELRTTEHRLIGRLRIANDRQLAAGTPRNQAPGDSWASLQLHESAINNTVAGLELGGRRFTPDELQQHLRARLQLPEPVASPAGEGPEEDAQLVFDRSEPVRVAFVDGQAELVLGIRELRVGRKKYSRFKVHAFYEPRADGMQASLVRAGGVQIEGRMRTGTRLRLHGVFGEVFKEDRPVPLLSAKLASDPRLSGLMVTQLVMTDGWLGLAIGPQQVAGKGRRVATVGRYVR